jgi:nitroimidazol reductase NimA-like FMN-containing flavoprotein (pyridoxamine 5'-phosphate oxidase superfamily)
VASAHLPPSLEVLYEEECLRLLATQEVGRLAVIEGGYGPLIVPVNYVVDGGDIVFLTDSGTKLRGATRSPVAFEVDDLDRCTRSGWSVVARGLARELSGKERDDLRRRLPTMSFHPWAPGHKPYLVRIVATTVTGRRIRPARG